MARIGMAMTLAGTALCVALLARPTLSFLEVLALAYVPTIGAVLVALGSVRARRRAARVQWKGGMALPADRRQLTIAPDHSLTAGFVPMFCLLVTCFAVVAYPRVRRGGALRDVVSLKMLAILAAALLVWALAAVILRASRARVLRLVRKGQTAIATVTAVNALRTEYSFQPTQARRWRGRSRRRVRSHALPWAISSSCSTTRRGRSPGRWRAVS